MQNQPEGKNKKWYYSGWRIALFGFLTLLVVFILGFGVLVLYYWREIKSGRGAVLEQSISYGGFSASVNNMTNSAIISRERIETTDDPFLGNADGEIVIVEFIDFKCPNCKTELPILKKVLNKYGQKVKLIVRDFPSESLHPGANKMAELAGCAYQQGLFWPVHDWLFQNQENLPTTINMSDMKDIADLTGLDYKKLNECMNSRAALVEVNRDYADGLEFGVVGTPTFFINGIKVQGVVPFEAWEAFFSKLNK